MDTTTENLINLLYQCGVSPLPRAKVLSFFLGNAGKELTSRTVEKESDLRQPEVSLAISAFVEKKWLTELPGKASESKGRPVKNYVLAIPVDAVFKSIAAGVQADIKTRTELLEKLRTAMLSPKPTKDEHMNTKEVQKVLL